MLDGRRYMRDGASPHAPREWRLRSAFVKKQKKPSVARPASNLQNPKSGKRVWRLPFIGLRNGLPNHAVAAAAAGVTDDRVCAAQNLFAVVKHKLLHNHVFFNNTTILLIGVRMSSHPSPILSAAAKQGFCTLISMFASYAKNKQTPAYLARQYSIFSGRGE